MFTPTGGTRQEQGDPLMPAPYTLAQHEAAKPAPRRRSCFRLFLDDVYVVALPYRIYRITNSTTEFVCTRTNPYLECRRRRAAKQH